MNKCSIGKILLLIFALIPQYSLAQNLLSNRNFENDSDLAIGDIVPNVSLGMLINDFENISKIGEEVYLKDLGRKLVILDFWSPYCSFCIEQFPKLKELQEKFKKDVIILPVGFSQQKSSGKRGMSINNLVTSWKGTYREVTLPITEITEIDYFPSPLRKLFPFQFVPNLVWIKDGRLIGITESPALIESNIKEILEDKLKSFKKRTLKKSISDCETFLLSTDYIDYTKKGIVFSKYIDSLDFKPLTIDRTYNGITRVFCINNSILSIYRDLMSKSYGSWAVERQRYLIETIKPFYKEISYSAHSNWEVEKILNEDYFCFDFMIRSESIESVFNYLKTEIDNYFKIETFVQKRNVKCLVLERASSLTTKVAIDERFYISNAGEYIFENYPAEDFFTWLKSFVRDQNLPILINGLNKNDRISAVFKHRSQSIQNVKESLEKNGILLRYKIIPMEMVIIKDKS